MADRPGVVIVGGGPAGASAAWHLVQYGLDVTIVDRAHFPRDKVCAEYLNPAAARLLEAMGAMGAITGAEPAYPTGIQAHSPRGSVAAGRFWGGVRGLALSRATLDAILLACARDAGARVLEGSRVTDVLRDRAGAVAGVRGLRPDGEPWEMPAGLVIGADGLRSVVARRTGLVRSARWPYRMAFVAHYRGVAGVRDMGEMHVERDGYMGIADVGRGVCNITLVVPAGGTGDAVRREPSGFLEWWLGARPGLAERFASARRVGPVRVTGPFARAAKYAWAPGVGLVGDAADFFDPFMGDGVYRALRGGELLAPYVAEAARAGDSRLRDRALAAYDHARRAEFRGKWMVERIIAGVVAVPAVMNHVARSLSHRSELADLMVSVAGGLLPAREVLRPGYVGQLLLFGLRDGNGTARKGPSA